MIDTEHGKEHAAKRSSGSGSGSGSGGGIGGGGHPILRELALVEMGKRRTEKNREGQRRTENREENRVGILINLTPA